MKIAFGSVLHQLLFHMLRAVRVPSPVLKSFYSQLFVIVATKNWEILPDTLDLSLRWSIQSRPRISMPLITDSLEVHTSVLQQIDQRAAGLD